MATKTQYSTTRHPTERGTVLFSAPVVSDNEPAWEFHSWQLDHGYVVALWVRKWPETR